MGRANPLTVIAMPTVSMKIDTMRFRVIIVIIIVVLVYIGSALAVPWQCLGGALAVPWQCLGSALVVPKKILSLPVEPAEKG